MYYGCANCTSTNLLQCRITPYVLYCKYDNHLKNLTVTWEYIYIGSIKACSFRFKFEQAKTGEITKSSKNTSR